MEQLTIPGLCADLGEIHFSVMNCRRMSARNGNELWSADFVAIRDCALIAEFRAITVIEQPGRLAYIAGIESASCSHRSLNTKAAESNQKFIRFLRQESAWDRTTRVHEASAYQCERAAMTGYMVARKLSHPFGVGFFVEDGQYQLLSIEWLGHEPTSC